jgi:hypothetical protein
MGVSGRQAPAALPSVKKPARIEYEADWRQSQCGRLRKDFLLLQRIEPRIMQPVARSHRLRNHRITIQKTTILNIWNMCMNCTDLKQTVGCEFSSDYSAQATWGLLIHLVVCLTTGPKPLPKRALHIVRSTASSFKWGYPLLSLSSSSSFLRLLPRLPVTYIPLLSFLQ